MIVLGLEGGLGSFSCALRDEQGVIGAGQVSAHASLEGGLGLVEDVLAQADLGRQSLSRVAVGVGPGAFTGVRIAISYAKSLALGWELPLVGVNSFDALEYGTPVRSDVTRLTVVRGRQGVISARVRRGDHEQRASGYISDVLEQLAPALSQPPVVLIGDAEDVLAALGEGGLCVEPLPRAVQPAAAAIAGIALQRQPAAAVHQVRADYGELPAARVPKNLRGT